MKESIQRITISGYKTFKQLNDFELKPLNVLIGANGAGKSNFIGFFIFLKEMILQRMQLFTNKKGGADAHLYLGPKESFQVHASLTVQDYSYKFSLEPDVDNRFIFSNETIEYKDTSTDFKSGHYESKISTVTDKPAYVIHDTISKFAFYHFHDTSETAYMRRQHSIRDYEHFRSDGSNLAAFLYHLKDKKRDSYELIKDTVNIVAPFFNDFILRPKEQSNGDRMIELEWSQKNTDYPFHPSQLSDGSLRFIALTTALLQPPVSSVMLFDEPELGLHPDALHILAGLFKQASQHTQIIVATQSPILLNYFDSDDIAVIDRGNGESKLRRLKLHDIDEWLKTYTLGELWQKNMFEGPVYE